MGESDNKNTEQKTNEGKEPEEAEQKFRPDEWMLRPCPMYIDEYKDCTSLRSRFYQYFIHGETLDCSQWKIDYKNCNKWKDTDDDTAYNELLESEKKRRLARLRPHVMNDVWKRRDAPPPDWNDPLPDWLAERDAGTFLAGKKYEIDTGGDKERELYMPSCSIL